MVEGPFCGNCGVAVAVDDRFCGACGAPQEVDATPAAKEGSLPVDHGEDVQGATGAAVYAAELEQGFGPASLGEDRPIAETAPVPGSGRAPKKSSRGFWDVAGLTMELIVRGVYLVLCGGLAVLAFQHGSPLIGLGAIAYGLYILAGGKWFIY
jgi:hypothetical protein